MTIERKVGMGIAGQPSGATDVADVFSTTLYTGTSGSFSVNNGIDLAGEGGMVWTKQRSRVGRNSLVDTERGNTKHIFTDSNAAEGTTSDSITAFNSNGYNLGGAGGGKFNTANEKHVSWTFRKKKKFFDVVTYTGNGSVRTIAHSLGGPVGFMAVKRLNSTGAFTTFHTSLGGTKFMEMHSTYQQQSSINVWNNTAPTDAVFSLGVDSAVNTSGGTYVAYLWADNSSEDAEEQMIKCGSYTTSSSGDSGDVNLGWEPQFVLFKNAGSADNWVMLDSMRGLRVAGVTDAYIYSNTNAAEGNANFGHPTSTGFRIINQANSVQYIYMAIRAPMMIEPEAATDVFSTVVGRSSNSGGKGNFLSGFPVDFAFARTVSGSGPIYATTRLTGKEHMNFQTTAQGANNAGILFDFSDGWAEYGFGTMHSWMWKRAKGFMDVVTWLGDGTSNGTNRPSHSLGVVPQMIISKARNNVDNWIVLHTEAVEGATSIQLNSATGGSTGNVKYYHGDHTNYIPPTDSQFAVCTGGALNALNKNYVSYLFATLAGISKVGSYTGNGSNNHVINCGFTNGARFVLIKKSSGSGQWYLFDSVRGITVGSTDPFIMLNLANAQQTEAAGLGPDAIQPNSSGFQLTSGSDLNGNSAYYIFYAIA